MRNDVRLVRATAVAAMTLFLVAGAALAADGDDHGGSSDPDRSGVAGGHGGGGDG